MAGGALLSGRVALITGGSRGLGAAIADMFAAHGAIGAAVDVELANVPAGWAELAADVTDERSVAEAVAATVEQFGRLDIVVANAGIVPPWTDTEGIDLAELERVLAVNVGGVAATLKHSVAPLRERGGAIVVTASVNAYRIYPRQHIYTLSKHAVLGLMRSAALDLGRFGIRVNALAPGPVLTDAFRGRLERRAAEGGLSVEAALQEAATATALGRLVTPDDVARAALFLASDLASGVTGVLLPVDAGLS